MDIWSSKHSGRLATRILAKPSYTLKRSLSYTLKRSLSSAPRRQRALSKAKRYTVLSSAGSVTLLNVVVAVLLDEFIATVVREKEAHALRVEAENDKRRIKGVLDPLTQKLCAFEDGENLLERIDDLWKRLDSDGSGGLDYKEFREGLKRLPGIGLPRLRASLACLACVPRLRALPACLACA